MSFFESELAELEALLTQASPTALDVIGVEPAPAGARAGLILAGESALELGAPDVASAFVTLYGNAEKGDAVRVVGSPLKAALGRHVPFALTVCLYGPEISAEVFHQFMLRFQRLADMPGWMVKRDKTRLWIRVGRTENPDAVLARFCTTLIGRIHEAFACVRGVHITAVIDASETVEALAGKAELWQQKLVALKAGVWKERGFDYKSCQLSGHCGACADKKTCASVRKMEARVKVHRRQQPDAQDH